MSKTFIKAWVVNTLAKGFYSNIYGIKFLLAVVIRIVWKKGFVGS